jgi:hypothetical protein
MPSNIPYHAAAVLVWLLPDQTPDVQNFDLSTASEPPHPNPEPWWNIKDAIFYAMELNTEKRQGKLPWIKWGHELLSPTEVAKNYNAMKAG